MFSIMVQPLGGLTPPYLMTLFTFDVPLPQQKVENLNTGDKDAELRRTEKTEADGWLAATFLFMPTGRPEANFWKKFSV